MSLRNKRIVLLTTLILMVALGSWIIVTGSSRKVLLYLKGRIVTQPAKTAAESDKRERLTSRNLSLQSEAFNMSRRLGSRFQPDKLQRTVLNGTLTVGPDSRHVEIIRTQTDRGEDVEIHLAGHQNVLEWTEADGVRSSSGAANQNDRLLIERLLFDSPDQFVLAQLRGASYSLVSTTVRPTDAGDDYSGPLWNVVRVAEPDTGPTKKPQSSWRLYYINVSTGLIDKVISESAGQKIVAEFADWTDLRGDKVPAHIRWTTSGQTLMQYDLIGLSHADTRGGNK